MKDKLIVPKSVKVGFQKRSDTYTGKLAYVIYTDAKGVLRKEKSWSSWRDQKIDPIDYDNVPTSGFVLNKDVGGKRNSWSSWDTRMEKVRVYDPRGFEFEITIPNMLFILQECTSTKGKGLEGEFVYGWDGTELILIPTCCLEYQKSLNFTDYQNLKVSTKDLKAGYLYKNKKMETVMCLGEHIWFNYSSQNNGKKCFIFAIIDADHDWYEAKVDAGNLAEVIGPGDPEVFQKKLDAVLKPKTTYGDNISTCTSLIFKPKDYRYSSTYLYDRGQKYDLKNRKTGKLYKANWKYTAPRDYTTTAERPNALTLTHEISIVDGELVVQKLKTPIVYPNFNWSANSDFEDGDIRVKNALGREYSV